ncbi:MAG: hypothetical protein J5I93_16560 [Pirellulaceae bacterium]|nr:hypothetical protein [Pirellulaceae bacterium]
MFKTHRGIWLPILVGAVLLAAGFWFKQSPTSAQQPAGGQQPMIWQQVKHAGGPERTWLYRAPVPGGWLVMVQRHEQDTATLTQGVGRGLGVGSGLTFVPDPEHAWK